MTPVQQWEYDIRFETPLLTSNKGAKQEHLNDMGNDGWELVAWVEDRPALLSYSIFKRPKQNT